MMHYGRILLLALLFSAILTACDQKKAGDASPAVAKVNGQEISAQQLGFAVTRIGNIPKDKEAEAGKQVLKRLVDQQILVKQALDKKLDQNANVQQAIEASRKQILAQAVFDQMAQQISKPTDTEIHDFYTNSPDLFANRRIYKLAEITIANVAQSEKVKQWLSEAKNLEEFAGKLHSEGIQYKTASAVKAAEEIPLALLTRLAKMAKGEVAVLPSGDSLSLLQLQDFRDQPMAEEQAKAVIANLLLDAKRKALFEAEMKKLRDVAKIEYLDAYAELGKEPQSPAALPSASMQAIPAHAAQTQPAADGK